MHQNLELFCFLIFVFKMQSTTFSLLFKLLLSFFKTSKNFCELFLQTIPCNIAISRSSLEKYVSNKISKNFTHFLNDLLVLLLFNCKNSLKSIERNTLNVTIIFFQHHHLSHIQYHICKKVHLKLKYAMVLRFFCSLGKIVEFPTAELHVG